jgi:hypothetical protein
MPTRIRELRNLLEQALARPGGFDRSAIYELMSSLAPEGEAHDRGLQLLKENLSPAQSAQFEKSGYFFVVGGQTGNRYPIRNGSQLNVDQLSKKGRLMRVLCFMPKGDLVDGDIMLAQKLALELFEADALKVARVRPADPRR